MTPTPSLLEKIIRYGLTAGVAALVDLGGFLLLLSAGLSVLVSAMASFGAAAIVNYVLSSLFAFRSRLSLDKFFRFLSFAIVGFAINVALTYVFAQVLGLPAPLSKIAGIGIAFIANFAMNALFVFKPPGASS